MYQVLARKWRPQGFDELVGQPHVARTLANAIKGDRLAHAYIFAGLRGTGKTSAARIFAKCLNCEQGPTPTPCQECTPCREIAESRALDVLEMDAASRTGIDDIRELQEVIAYPPVRDRYKLLILDEAHMLSKNAVNALLKTLEEPPARVVFVLATTEIQKIIPTVLSRCQVFEFRRVTPKETAAHLRKLCEQEKIEIPDVSLERLARAGEGSVRDSLSLLERVIAFCGTTIEDDDVLRVLGSVRAEVLAELMQALAARDAAAMLRVLDGLVDEGHDLVHFWGELISALRDLLLMDALPDRTELLARSAEEARSLAAAAEGLSREDLSRVFQIVADLEPGLKSSSQPRYLFEATLVRLASLGAVRPIEEVLAGLGRTGPAPAPSGAAPGRRGGAAPASGGRGGGGSARGRGAQAARDEPQATAGGGAARDPRAELLEAVSGRPLLAALLAEAGEVRREGDRLSVTFAPDQEALRRQVTRSENIEALTRSLRKALGPEVRLEIAGGADPGATDAETAPAARETAGPDPSPPAPAEPRREAPAPRAGGRPAPADRGKLMQQATSEPGVRRLLREFGAQVVDIRPLGVTSTEPEDTTTEERP